MVTSMARCDENWGKYANTMFTNGRVNDVGIIMRRLEGRIIGGKNLPDIQLANFNLCIQ